MQLTLREVGKLLNVSEFRVNHWIKQRGLPAQFVAGQYRFHRAELLEWATANQIKVSHELFDHFETENEAAPSIALALEAGGIFRDLQAANKEQALRALMRVLPLPAGIDRELILRLYLAREACASTAIGGSIALPHVRNPMVLHVDRPLVTLCFLERAVDFGALDGKPVQILFSLICPSVRSHLQMLSRLSYAVHDDGFREVVLRQGPREEILVESRRLDAALGAAGKAAS